MNRRELLTGAAALAASAVLPAPSLAEAGPVAVTPLFVGIDYGMLLGPSVSWVLAQEIGPGRCRVLEVLDDDDPRIGQYLGFRDMVITGSVSV